MTSTTTVIARVTNNVATTLLSVSTTWATGDKIGVRVEGSTIQAWQAGVG